MRSPRLAVLAAFCWLVASCAATEPDAPPDAAEPAAARAPGAAVPAPAPSAPSDAPTRERMAEIFAAMRFLLPLSLDPQAFADPTRRRAIDDALTLLDDSAESLARHGASREVSFSHLARSLAIDARDAHQRFEQGHMIEVRYLVQTLTETCVACHSRLPAASDAPRSEAFMDDAMVETLPRERRARLAYATRQFDEAATLYEAILADPSFPSGDVDQENLIDDYLELAIRVRGEPGRALDTLERFATRPDLAPAFRAGVGRWIESLERLVARGPVTSPIAVARAEIDQAVAAGRTGGNDRDALIEYLDASGLLHRHLADARLPHADQAEAYYLLGVVETRIGRSYWLSQAEAYLETAIRLAPGEPVAKDAYALLEEYLGAGYSGAAGANLPSDVREKLALLRRISEGEVPARE